MGSVVYAVLVAASLVILIDAVRYYGGAFREFRRQRRWEEHVEAAVAITDTSVFDETVAAMPEVAERSVVDEAESILRSAGGER